MKVGEKSHKMYQNVVVVREMKKKKKNNIVDTVEDSVSERSE